jgi:RanBP-type and C3HC4-type zinc finger-containing protein 1
MIKCPYSSDYNCGFHLQEREIRALLSEEDYLKYQMRSLRQSEATMKNTFHCKTPDCIGFCVFEDNLNFFDCNFLFSTFNFLDIIEVLMTLYNKVLFVKK